MTRPAAQPLLFEELPTQEKPEVDTSALSDDAANEVRLKRAERHQVELRSTLDELLPPEHAARAIWAMVEKLDLTALYRRVAARGGNAGAPAIDPKVTLVLWIYATSEGVGSAREIEELCKEHAAYQWIRGGVRVKAHHLSDFRSRSGKVFGELVTQVVALLLKHGLVDLTRVSLDGTRVRTSAGAASFRREESLKRLRDEAYAHLKAVLAEGADPKMSAIRKAARERAAQERVDRIKSALSELEHIKETREPDDDRDEPRVSTTDPRARVMKMADGGFRPAYNVQLATTSDAARVIVGVDVTPFGTDQGEAPHMMDDVKARTGAHPQELLIDGGFLSNETIETLAADGVRVRAPLKKKRAGAKLEPGEPRASDTPSVAAWRADMQTEEAKEIYKLRAATSETVNADLKTHRALDKIPIRGLKGAFAIAALNALTYDILRGISLFG